MPIFDRFRSVNTITTSVDYELLTDMNISNSIKERLQLTDEEYLDLITEGISNMYFQIYGTGFTVQVNDEDPEPLIGNEVYTTGDFIRKQIRSIKISNNNAPILFRFNIL